MNVHTPLKDSHTTGYRNFWSFQNTQEGWRKMTGNVKVTMKKKMGICIWVGCMILIVAALCLCLMAVGRDSVYIDGTFVQHSGDSAEAFLRPDAQTEKAAL